MSVTVAQLQCSLRRRLGGVASWVGAVLVVAWAGSGRDAAAAADVRRDLTLAQAQETALRENPGVAAAAERIAAADAEYRQARSAYYPTITLGADASHTGAVAAADGGLGLDPFQAYGISAGVYWLVFDGFAREAAVMAADYSKSTAGYGLRDAQRLLLQAVSVAFNRALLAMENVTISRDDAVFNQRLADEVQKRLDAGAASRSELLNFQVRAAQAQDRLLLFRDEYRLARIALAELMGLPDGNLGEGVRLVFDGTPDVPAHEHDAEVAFALAHRPDVLAQAVAVERSVAEVRAARGGYWPRIGVQALYGESRLDNLHFNDDADAQSFLGISAEWDVFTGGRVAATVELARSGLYASRFELERRRLAVIAAVRAECQRLQTASERLRVQAQVQAMTAEIKELVLKEYLAGKSSLTRLNEAQTDLVRASGGLALARIRVAQAMQNLDAATGR